MDSLLVIGRDVGGSRVLVDLLGRRWRRGNLHVERTGCGEAAGELVLEPVGRTSLVAAVPSSRAALTDCSARAGVAGAAQIALGAFDGGR